MEAGEADFNTYAAAAVTWSVVGLDTSGNVVIQSQNAFFQNVSGANPNTLGGAWLHIDDAGPPIVDVAVNYFPFTVPINMTTALASMGVKIVLTLPTLTGYAIVEY